MASATSEQSGGGPNATVRHLYSHFHDVDDGTWWSALQPGARGYGIMPWRHADDLTIGSFYANLNTGSLAPWYQGETLGVAFVEWSRSINNGLDLQIDSVDGLDLQIDSVGCYDHDYKSPVLIVDPDFRSVVRNCLITHEDHLNGSPSLWAPVWAVAPIDEHFFWQWMEEATEGWAETLRRDQFTAENLDYETEISELDEWACCGDPGHRGECHWSEWMHEGGWDDICPAVIIAECPCEKMHDCNMVYCACSNTAHICDGTWRLLEIDNRQCECGYAQAEEGLWQYARDEDKLGLVYGSYSLLDLITYDRDTFLLTVDYAIESFYRGWMRCAELVHNERSRSTDIPPSDLEPYWFSSYWHQSAPFLDLSGPERQAVAQLPLFTSSVTSLAS